jgi:2-polyprenyl-3-methyl-5-hydroxy-6-metoxy-1,4-benzoquinol methylase
VLPLLEPFGPCPGCGSSSARPLHVFRNRRSILPVPFVGLVGCETCGLMFSVPRPTEAALDAFYDPDEQAADGWRRITGGLTQKKLDKLDVRFEPDRAMARRAVPFILEAAGAPSGILRPSVLDFGCGGGAFLDAFAMRGWETFGIEPNAIGALAARRHRMIDAVPSEPTFDFVVLNQVLEHLLSPRETLSAIAAAARPGAMLFAAVPDVDTVAEHGDLRYVAAGVHINSFTSTALQNVLRVSGWTPLRVFPRQEWSPYASAAGEGNAFGVLARRTDSADQAELSPHALESAIEALRAWGRNVGADGKFRRPESLS